MCVTNVFQLRIALTLPEPFTSHNDRTVAFSYHCNISWQVPAYMPIACPAPHVRKERKGISFRSVVTVELWRMWQEYTQSRHYLLLAAGQDQTTCTYSTHVITAELSTYQGEHM